MASQCLHLVKLLRDTLIALLLAIPLCSIQTSAQDSPTGNQDSNYSCTFNLQSEVLATPATIPLISDGRPVNLIRIFGELDSSGIGSGFLVCEEGEWQFNSFGDASLSQLKRKKKIPVQFHLEGVNAQREKLIRVTFEPTRSEQDLYLLLTDKASLARSSQLMLGVHQRYLVGNAKPPRRTDTLSPTQVIQLFDRVPIAEKTDDSQAGVKQTLPPKTSLASGYVTGVAENPSDLGLLEVPLRNRRLSKLICLDQNKCSYEWSGKHFHSAVTMVAYPGYLIKLEALRLKDPLNRGRSLYHVEFLEENRIEELQGKELYLVADSSESEPYRLLVRQGEDLQYVYRMTSIKR
ncbi:hypothetical protein [Adhaeretor mobilis]|uniref:Uncharacterized protein n=1 Tax=Adhaeretor mobilis TaxID=1930276 RepID=A0A517N2K3_9BACT|nr:hypothetical protein [Adhaeretor mobilis]QDT01228.1 hypothetical protein HG15A2_45700 [Adhaeretor mobilis]